MLEFRIEGVFVRRLCRSRKVRASQIKFLQFPNISFPCIFPNISFPCVPTTFLFALTLNNEYTCYRCQGTDPDPGPDHKDGDPEADQEEGVGAGRGEGTTKEAEAENLVLLPINHKDHTSQLSKSHYKHPLNSKSQKHGGLNGPLFLHNHHLKFRISMFSPKLQGCWCGLVMNT